MTAENFQLKITVDAKGVEAVKRLCDASSNALVLLRLLVNPVVAGELSFDKVTGELETALRTITEDFSEEYK